MAHNFWKSLIKKIDSNKYNYQVQDLILRSKDVEYLPEIEKKLTNWNPENEDFTKAMTLYHAQKDCINEKILKAYGQKRYQMINNFINKMNSGKRKQIIEQLEYSLNSVFWKDSSFWEHITITETDKTGQIVSKTKTIMSDAGRQYMREVLAEFKNLVSSTSIKTTPLGDVKIATSAIERLEKFLSSEEEITYAKYASFKGVDLFEQIGVWLAGRFAESVGQTTTNITHLDSGGKTHNYKVAISSDITVALSKSSISQILNDIKTNAQTADFVVDDEWEDLYDRISKLRIQAKSSKGLNIFNKNKQNQLTLADVGFQTRYKILEDLYTIYRNCVEWVEPGKSRLLAALANYNLSKNLHKTKALTDNDIYFTPFGFQTAAQYLDNFARGKGRGAYFGFDPNVYTLNEDNFYNIQRSLKLNKI